MYAIKTTQRYITIKIVLYATGSHLQGYILLKVA